MSQRDLLHCMLAHAPGETTHISGHRLDLFDRQSYYCDYLFLFFLFCRPGPQQSVQRERSGDSEGHAGPHR